MAIFCSGRKTTFRPTVYQPFFAVACHRTIIANVSRWIHFRHLIQCGRVKQRDPSSLQPTGPGAQRPRYSRGIGRPIVICTSLSVEEGRNLKFPICTLRRYLQATGYEGKAEGSRYPPASGRWAYLILVKLGIRRSCFSVHLPRYYGLKDGFHDCSDETCVSSAS